MYKGCGNVSILLLLLILLFLICSTPDSLAQEEKSLEDSTSLTHKKKFLEDSKFLSIMKSEGHSPQKSTIYSAIIPGWGQAYNKKYWKVPIVWAGLGAVGYFIYDNQSKYTQYKDYYITLSEFEDSTIQVSPTIQLTSAGLGELLTSINTVRKNRDLSVIILFAVWGLNVIDANVDGHFFSFDVDEDLSLRLSPAVWSINQRRKAYGLNLVLNLY